LSHAKHFSRHFNREFHWGPDLDRRLQMEENAAGRDIGRLGAKCASRRFQSDLEVQRETDGISQLGLVASGHHIAIQHDIEKPPMKAGARGTWYY